MATARAPRRPLPPANTKERTAVVTGFEFEFEGNTYRVAPAEEWGVEVMESLEDGKALSFVRALLGLEQWATFKATSPSMTQLNDLGAALMAAAGLGN